MKIKIELTPVKEGHDTETSTTNTNITNKINDNTNNNNNNKFPIYEPKLKPSDTQRSFEDLMKQTQSGESVRSLTPSPSIIDDKNIIKPKLSDLKPPSRSIKRKRRYMSRMGSLFEDMFFDYTAEDIRTLQSPSLNRINIANNKYNNNNNKNNNNSNPNIDVKSKNIKDKFGDLLSPKIDYYGINLNLLTPKSNKVTSKNSNNNSNIIEFNISALFTPRNKKKETINTVSRGSHLETHHTNNDINTTDNDDTDNVTDNNDIQSELDIDMDTDNTIIDDTNQDNDDNELKQEFKRNSSNNLSINLPVPVFEPLNSSSFMTTQTASGNSTPNFLVSTPSFNGIETPKEVPIIETKRSQELTVDTTNNDNERTIDLTNNNPTESMLLYAPNDEEPIYID